MNESFIAGEERQQETLLQDTLVDFVTDDNPVLAIDVNIEEIDLAAMGFSGVAPEATGRPAYHITTLLKIYLYGYPNRTQSSRRFERETQRNVEPMWLTGRLMPEFKTIADFRRDGGLAVRAACAQFVVLCHQLSLFTRAVVAVDGASSRPSTTATKTSRWPKSPSASSRWRPASRAISPRWNTPTGNATTCSRRT